jgi:glycosyltransferase involved in cell wall biosynthesis
MKILFVIPDLHYGGVAKQLMLVAAGLARDGFQLRVCVLGGDSPWAQQLRAAGVAVDNLGWKRLIEPFWRLRPIVRNFQPHLIHAWRLPAFRAVLLAEPTARAVVSYPLPPTARNPTVTQLDRWLLRRMARVVATGPAGAAAYESLGLSAANVAVIPPGVVTAESALTPDQPPVAVPEGARVVACIGPLEPHKGFRDALWAFDILHFLYDNLHVLMLGAGADRDRLRDFVGGFATPDRIHFLGQLADPTPVYARAEMVWVPSHKNGGINVALEAMAAGKPVLASSLPSLREVVVPGETGELFEPGDKAGLARLTRRLLQDPDQCRRLGEAGRQRAEKAFSVRELVARHVTLYEEIAGAPT